MAQVRPRAFPARALLSLGEDTGPQRFSGSQALTRREVTGRGLGAVFPGWPLAPHHLPVSSNPHGHPGSLGAPQQRACPQGFMGAPLNRCAHSCLTGAMETLAGRLGVRGGTYGAPGPGAGSYGCSGTQTSVLGALAHEEGWAPGGQHLVRSTLACPHPWGL